MARSARAKDGTRLDQFDFGLFGGTRDWIASVILTEYPDHSTPGSMPMRV